MILYLFCEFIFADKPKPKVGFIHRFLVIFVISPIILILIGIAVGILTGVTGSSGVLIVVPALSLLGLSFQESVGSSLLVDVITTISVL